MAKYLVTDVATTTLASGIAEGATSCTVQAGAGALFPQPNTSTGTKFLATFVSASNPNTKGVVTCTARSTDTMTITPTTQAWDAGDTFAILNQAELIQQLVQFDDLQAQAGNYALDVGSANAYVVGLTPSLSAHIAGAPIVWLAAHANTGASTFNDGAGNAALVRPNGTAVVPGDIAANCIYISRWNSASSAFQLDAVTILAFSQLTGTVSDAQLPSSPPSSWISQTLENAALTGTPVAPTAASGTQNTQIATTAFVQTAATAAAAAAANPGSSIGPTGYKSYIDGFVEQWGSFTTNGGNVAVTFYENFPTACYGVWMQPVGNTGAAYLPPLASPPTKGGFTAETSVFASGLTVYYRAIGN